MLLYRTQDQVDFVKVPAEVMAFAYPVSRSPYEYYYPCYPYGASASPLFFPFDSPVERYPSAPAAFAGGPLYVPSYGASYGVPGAFPTGHPGLAGYPFSPAHYGYGGGHPHAYPGSAYNPMAMNSPGAYGGHGYGYGPMPSFMGGGPQMYSHSNNYNPGGANPAGYNPGQVAVGGPHYEYCSGFEGHSPSAAGITPGQCGAPVKSCF